LVTIFTLKGFILIIQEKVERLVWHRDQWGRAYWNGSPSHPASPDNPG